MTVPLFFHNYLDLLFTYHGYSCLSLPIIEGNPAHSCMVLTNAANHQQHQPQIFPFSIHPSCDLLFTSHGYDCLSLPSNGNNLTHQYTVRPNAVICQRDQPQLAQTQSDGSPILERQHYVGIVLLKVSPHRMLTTFKEIKRRSTPASLLTWRGIDHEFAMRWRPRRVQKSSPQAMTYAILN